MPGMWSNLTKSSVWGPATGTSETEMYLMVPLSPSRGSVGNNASVRLTTLYVFFTIASVTRIKSFIY